MSSNKMLKVIHIRSNCIGCNACVTLAPQSWVMDPVDGKSRLVGSKCKGKVFVGEIFECDTEDNIRAAEACPVNIIKIGS